MNAPDVIVVNPLGGALRHYTRGLVRSLVAAGGRVSVSHVDEPSVGGGSGLGWVRRYLGALVSARRRVRRDGARVVVTWPVLGHLDRLVLRAVLGRRAAAALVVHDPRPLVRAHGYGRVARRLASLAGGVRVVVHSAVAETVLRHDCPELVPDVLPHPVVPRDTERPAAGPDGRPTPDGRHAALRTGLPVVRVLGQYKPDRDLVLLAGIGRALAATHRLEVVGRGWPPVDGWSVTDEFVPEDRLDELIATADAVVVPYRRFFQSGIAVRSLELGTPAVGPADSSIADLYPDDRYLASESVGSWCRAIDAASRADRRETRELAVRADRACRAAWSAWLTDRAAVS